MDRKNWFIDFAKIAGRKNLNAYAIGVIKSILCCDRDDPTKQVAQINNATESLEVVLNDESLPWDVQDVKKAPTAMEAPKEIAQTECTINMAKVEPLVDREMAEEVLKEIAHERN